MGNSDQRKQGDLNFFDIFRKEGLKSEHPPTVLKAIRLGKSSAATEPMIRPSTLKLVFENKDKINIFRLLRNLKTADEKFRNIRVPHDYYQATRKLIKVMIEEAKTRDGEKSESFIYTIRGPGSHLEVQKRKKTNENKSREETAVEDP